MVIDAAELKKRQGYIGASDGGIILGASPFKTARDLWYDKVFGATFKGNAATRRGNKWEPMVISFAEEHIGKKIIQDVRYERHYELDGHTVKFAANCDGIVAEEGCEVQQYDRFFYGEHIPKQVVEAKTARSVDHWGLPGTDAIPDTYLIQTCIQMWCSGATFAWVPVMCGFDEYMYQVKRPPEADLDELIHKMSRWWVDHVVAKVEPEGPPPKVSVLNTIPREEGSAIELAPDSVTIAQRWEEYKELANKYKALAEEQRTTLIGRLKNCEIGMLPPGRGHMSYVANKAGVRTLKWNKER